MIKLHGIWHSAATNRVLTVLLEKEVEFTLVTVNSYAGECKKPEHLALHPFGQVPVLQDGDFTLFESRAIMRYVCERFPRQGTLGLYDYTGADKALVEQWLEVESQVLQPVLRPLVKQLLGPRMWNAQNVAVVPDEKIVAEHTQKLAKILDVYEVQLSKHKYLAGDFVSIADLSHLPMTYYYFCVAKQPHLLTSRKHVAAWFDAISTRPSWCTVLEHAAPFFTKWAT